MPPPPEEPWLVPQRFGSVRYPPGGTFVRSHQPWLQWVGVHKGSLEVRQDGKAFPVGPGRHFFMVPGHAYQLIFSTRQATSHTWFDLSPEVPPALLPLHDNPSSRPLGGHLDRAMAFFHGLHPEERKAPSPVFLDFSAAFLGEVLRQFSAPDPGEHPERQPREVQEVLDWMHVHYADPVDLKDFADEIGVSREHLIRLFRKVLGRTPMDCLWSCRIDRAREFLSSTGLSVAEVASQSGFATTAHFSRRFQQATGSSPRAFRARIPAGLSPFPPVA